MSKTEKSVSGLGLWGLTAVVISSMIGSGVYSLPQNMAAGADVGAIVIAWIITGVGMYFIAETFRILSIIKSDMTAGIYVYAQDGFGPITGFFTAWGYWLCQVFADIGYAVILMESLNYFFAPHFAGGNNINSFILSTVMIWAFCILTLKGIKTAALVNLIGTFFKLIPIIIFILIALITFKLSVFLPGLFDNLTFKNFDITALPNQIKSTMFITLWCFIGVETAVALSDRANKSGDISKATFFGFIICLVIYILISLLPFGILDRQTIADFANPSTAGILESIIGKPGAFIMIIGLIVSVLFAFLAWLIVAVELPFSASRAGAYFPAQFQKQNNKGAPSFSLFVTTLAMQGALIFAFFSENAWNLMLSITGVMVMPVYLLTSAYLYKISSKKRFPSGFGISKNKACLTAVMAVIYSAWLIYAAGIKYLLMAIIFFAVGIPVCISAIRQKKKLQK
ncbi:MAG: basic amino acid/polyamine antiporter [Elusimicrobiota bacterium]|nr:basic amino acid/polyamine antiporter [Elusimicrobiota bacterium]